ncbi:MAG: WD40 repeat domain-containing protein, partial [Gemmataceae bacterium]
MRTIALAALFVAPFSAADEPTNTPHKPLGSHAGGIASVHFSPDGKLVASGGGDKSVRVTDVATGTVVHSWKGPSSFTCVVRFSPDGKTLAAAGYESGTGNAIYRFDVKTGNELPLIAGHATGGVRRLDFTPDGKTLVSAGFDGHVRVWDAPSGKELRSFKADAGTVYGLALSPDGRLAATAGRDGLRVWEVATGREQKHPAMGQHSCVAVAFSPDGKLIASGDGGTVTLWELATGREAATLRGFKGELSYLVFSADGRTLATGSYDKVIRLWDVPAGKLIREAEAHTGWVWGIGLSPDEKQLVSCSVDGTLKLWDMAKLGRPVHTTRKLTEIDAEARWKELSSRDPERAYQAVWALAGDPSRSVPLLAVRLAAARGEGPAASDIERMIRGLDSDEWSEREASSKGLAKVGPHARTLLVRAL